MPQNITDVATYTDPIVMPADTDPADLTYIEMALQGLANRTKRAATLLGGTSGTGEWVYPSVRSRTLHVTAAHMLGESDLQLGYDVNMPFLKPVAAGTKTALLDLNRLIPSSAFVTRIKAIVARDSGAETCALNHLRAALNFTTGAATATRTALASDSATIGNYVLDSGSISEAISGAGNPLLVEIQLGATTQRVFAVEIQYTDNGPRND